MRVQPQVHIGEIKTSIVLDMASPVAALLVSRFLASLASEINIFCDSLTRIVPEVLAEVQSGSFAWRIDTCVAEEEGSSDWITSDWIISWIERISDAGQDTSSPASDYYLPASSPTLYSLPAYLQRDSRAMLPRTSTNNSNKTQTVSSVSYVLPCHISLLMTWISEISEHSTVNVMIENTPSGGKAVVP